MRRLARALRINPPAGQSGLRIKRDMRFEYQAPDASRANHTAVVIIETSTAYLYHRPPPKQPEDSTQASDADASLGLDMAADDALSDPDAEFFQETHLAPKLRQAPIVNAPVPEPRKQESQTFLLIYVEGQWQLEKEPESDLDRQLFKYALAN